MKKLGEILKTLDGLMDYVDDRIDKAKRGPRPERVYALNELTRIKAELLNAKNKVNKVVVNSNTSFKDSEALIKPGFSTSTYSSAGYPYTDPAYIFQKPYGYSYGNKESSGDDVAAGEKDSNEGLLVALLKMFEEIERENDEADIKGIEPKHITFRLKFREPW